MGLDLAIEDLAVRYRGRRRGTDVDALRGVSLTVAAGEVLGVVGESGCGKSTLARVVLGLLRPTAGSVRIGGQEMHALRPRDRRALRRNMQPVFQDPMASLNPRFTVGTTLREPLQVHRKLRGEVLAATVVELLEAVGLSPELAQHFPHQLSGGQRQRLAIARALSVEPQLLIADEPLSALDVSVQAQVANLLANQQRQQGLTLMLIAHDLRLVHHLCDRVAVLYAGRVVEMADGDTLRQQAQHPYTQLMQASIPGSGVTTAPPATASAASELPTKGCRFAPRCALAVASCRQQEPSLHEAATGHTVACDVVRSRGQS